MSERENLEYLRNSCSPQYAEAAKWATARIEELEKSNASWVRIAEARQDEYDGRGREIEKLRQMIHDLRNDKSSLRLRIDELITEIEKLEQRATNWLQMAIPKEDEAARQNYKQGEEIRRLKHSCDRYEDQIRELEKRAKNLGDMFKDKSAHVKCLEKENEKLRKEIEFLKTVPLYSVCSPVEKEINFVKANEVANILNSIGPQTAMEAVMRDSPMTSFGVFCRQLDWFNKTDHWNRHGGW